MPGYQASNVLLMFLLQCKNLWKNCVEWRNSCQQIPEKDQSYVKVSSNNVHCVKVLKLWVRLWSIFHCNVNGELTFNEQWMKKNSQDSTLDFFLFLSKNFFSKIWAVKFRVQLICGFLWLFLLTVSLLNLTYRSQELGKWSATKWPLDCLISSPCQHLRKRIGNSMENMHTDVRV